MRQIKKLFYYFKLYTFSQPHISKTPVSNNIFIYFGVVGDLVLFYNFLEQYCRLSSQQVILVTLKNALPFLHYMDKENSYIDFKNSIFFDSNPTERALNINDITNLKKLIALEPEKAYAMPYEIDFFTFLILNLIPAKSKHGFISSGQSLLRYFLLTLVFPKIRFDTLPLSLSNSRIKAHSETFFRIGNKLFTFKGHDELTSTLNYAVISPFASSDEREYPYTKFKKISTQLYLEYGIRSIYLGQTDLIEQDNEAISFEYNIPINQLFERIQNCTVFIGNDSGLSHIALRYNKKTVVLFSRMEQYGLYFPYNNAIMICNKNISEIEPNEIVQKSIQ